MFERSVFMEYEKICNFIKELRVENNWSQEKLASMLYVDTSTINRWEKCKRYPNLDDLYKLSEIFNVSIGEILAGERISKNNNNQIQTSVYKYIKNVFKQMNKLKICIVLLVLLLVVSVICFLSIYFFENYRSIRVYTFSGNSDTYTIKNGILVLTKEKIYFQVGDISPKPKEVSLIVQTNDENKIVFQGDFNNIICDSFGYDSFVSYKDFVNHKENIIIKIKDEEIVLNFNEDFINDGVINIEDNNIGNGNRQEQDDLIIKDSFICDEQDYCYLNKDDVYISYNLGIFTVSENNGATYIYDLMNSFLYYETKFAKANCNLKIENENIVSLDGNCEDAQNRFNYFKQNYIDIYFNK